MNQTVDFIFAAPGATTDKTHRGLHARALAALCGRLDAAGVARVGEAILGMLGNGEANLHIPEALAEAAEHQDAEGSLRTAEQLVLVLRNSKANSPVTRLLKSSLVSACRRLDAAGTGRVSEAIVAAVRYPQTSILVHILFTHVFRTTIRHFLLTLRRFYAASFAVLAWRAAIRALMTSRPCGLSW